MHWRSLKTIWAHLPFLLPHHQDHLYLHGKGPRPHQKTVTKALEILQTHLQHQRLERNYRPHQREVLPHPYHLLLEVRLQRYQVDRHRGHHHLFQRDKLTNLSNYVNQIKWGGSRYNRIVSLTLQNLWFIAINNRG